MSIPIANDPNHITCIGIVKTDNCIIAGPGHRPPIPHPKPKQAAPTNNFQSITELDGLNNSYPKYEYFPTYNIIT